MKRNVDTVLTDLNGKELPDPFDPSEDKPAWTIKSALHAALLNSQSKDAQPDQVEALKRYRLAQKIYPSGGVVELNASEIQLAEKCVAQMYSPLVIGRIHDSLQADYVEVAAAKVPVKTKATPAPSA